MKGGIAALLTGLLLSGTVAAQPTALVVFGDSLSDTGNAFAAIHEPPSPPYFEGRFSNGPVWIELVAREFQLDATAAISGGNNFAVGGAKTEAGADSLTNQVRLFLVQRGLAHLNPNDLFVVFGGGNDVRDALESADPVSTVSRIALNIRDIIDTLANRGAATFLVPNLPNKGLTPAARARGTSEEEQTLTIAFNTALDTVLADVANRRGLAIIRVNLFDLFQNALAMPGTFGFSNVTEPCLVEEGSVFDVCATPETYIFWDDIHPTARAHAFIASAAIAAYRLAAPPGTVTGVANGFPKALIESVKREVEAFVSDADTFVRRRLP